MRVAMVGSGISGLAAAHALHGQSLEWSGSAQTFCDAMNTLRSPTVLRAFVIPGGSHLKFTADGLVDFHRDYWDAAEELYEKLPVVGRLMHWLKKRAQQ